MKVDIVIPAYNVAPWIGQCLDSVSKAVLACSRSNKAVEFEAVCVDDGSIDSTGAILDGFAACKAREDSPDFRVRIVHQDNQGVSPARNAALSVLTGDWVLFVDADDLLSEEIFIDFFKVVSECDCDIVRFRTTSFADGDTPDWCGGTLRYRKIDLSAHLRYSELVAPLWGAFYRRAILPPQGFRPYCRGEDRLFVSECLVLASSVVSVNAIAYGYRHRPGSAMTSEMTQRKLFDRIGCMTEWLALLTGTKKVIDGRIYREISGNLTEQFVYDLLKLPVDSRGPVWKGWFEFVRAQLSSYKCIPCWYRIIVWLLSLWPSKMLACILCYVPMWLKLKGLHR